MATDFFVFFDDDDGGHDDFDFFSDWARITRHKVTIKGRLLLIYFERVATHEVYHRSSTK